MLYHSRYQQRSIEQQQIIMIRLLVCFLFLLLFCSSSSTTTATIYRVGPTQTYKSIGAVMDIALPLKPGDQIIIDAKSTPYYEKFVINDLGTIALPIIIRGVPDPTSGALPIIDGTNAVTSRKLDYWNENRNILKIGGASYPTNDRATNIIIDKLHIRNARVGITFQDDHGTTSSYIQNAACIHIEIGTNITIQNSIIENCGNGIFVSSASKLLVIESNYIYGNGNVNSAYEHNVYTEADGIIYRYNYFGPLLSGALGNNLKDRSAGLVVAYNLIVGGNRQLDLVNTDDTTIQSNPKYRTTYVYGNILFEMEGIDNRQLIHYGGDGSDTTLYRKGILALYHNTFISTRIGRTTLLRLSTNDETCDARNNIIYVTSTTTGNQLELLSENRGYLYLYNNWMKDGYVTSFDMSGTGSVVNTNPMIGLATLVDPGFFMDSSFTTSYDVRLSKTVGPTYPLNNTSWPKIQYQYVRYQAYETRSTTTDVGAYMYSGGSSPIVTTPIATTPLAPPPPTTAPIPKPVVPPSTPTTTTQVPVTVPTTKQCRKKGIFCLSLYATRCCSKRCFNYRCT